MSRPQVGDEKSRYSAPISPPAEFPVKSTIRASFTSLGSLTIALACSKPTVELPAPPTAGATSLLLAFDLQPARVFAVDLQSSDGQNVELVVGEEPVALYAVLYDLPLIALGLTEGELTFATEGLAFPMESRPVLMTRIGGDESVGWIESQLPDRIRALHFPIRDRCGAAPHFAVET